MNHQERSQLLDSLLESDISEADFLRIEAELSIDPAVRQEYYERLTLSMILGTTPVAGAKALVGRIEPVRPSQWLNWFMLIAATAAMLMMAISWRMRSQPTKPQDLTIAQQTVEQQASGYAVVVGQSGAVWLSESSGLPRVIANGALLPAGRLQLTEGIVQLELFSGVSLVVEGKAEFEVLSPMEMTVSSGKVRANVPNPAHGFRIHTGAGDAVDLGTEFAVNVSDEFAEVHVLEGEVEWHPPSSRMRTLTKGEATRFNANGPIEELASGDKSFVGAAELQAQLVSERQSRRDAWLEYCQSLNRDHRLVAHYRLATDEQSGRRLPNLMSTRSTPIAPLSSLDHAQVGEAAVVAATATTDRFGQLDGALDFSPTGSRVRVSAPGVYRSLTLLCWVKINSLDRWYNSLFLTDGHNLHEPHWQIMDDGRLFFSVKKRDQWDRQKGELDKHIFYSPPFWDSSLSGQWLMLATVYNVQDQHVTHYLNGERLSREAVPEGYLVEQVSIGNASLGNWGLPERDEPRFAVRNFNGSMDEFLLFGAALPDNEINDIYEAGHP